MHNAGRVNPASRLSERYPGWMEPHLTWYGSAFDTWASISCSHHVGGMGDDVERKPRVVDGGGGGWTWSNSPRVRSGCRGLWLVEKCSHRKLICQWFQLPQKRQLRNLHARSLPCSAQDFVTLGVLCIAFLFRPMGSQ